MKTGKETKPRGNIHRQQLFYWMGASLDRKNRNKKVFSDALVKECLVQLRGSLEKGLWVKSPRVPEEFEFRGRAFALQEPIACFTEWSLGESLPHTSEYGRIGLGFPKRWVIERGGQSVTYFRHNQKATFLQSMFKLLDALGQDRGQGVWTAKTGISGFEELRYLIHFAKMVRLKKTPPRSKITPPTVVPRVISRKKPAKAAVDAQTFKRKFGLPLEFLEEREWRIVHHPAANGFVRGPASGVPNFYLPYVPGEELFTLVLPDHKVVCSVLQKDWFTERLFTPWKHYSQLKGRRVPPVMLLSHSDIDTF
jgi:hypothetical protein